MADPFRNYQWLFVAIMPFGPIMLDLQGVYQSPLYLYLYQTAGRARGILGASSASWNTGKYCRTGAVVLARAKKPSSRWSIGSTSQDS